jgi:molybdate transport system permease protein
MTGHAGSPVVSPVTSPDVSAGRPPLRLLLLGGLAAVALVVPLVALVVDAPWDRLLGRVSSPASRAALWLSLWTSTVTAVLCLLLGIPLAWLLARVPFPGRSLLRGLVTVPLVLPPVVAGVALLSAFGRTGLLGTPLRELLGVQIPYTSTAVVLSHVFVALPFFVITVEGAFRGTPIELETTAATLGADRWTTFRRVTLPLALPGVLAGTVLAWARSLGEFGATITFAGNYPGSTRTMPLEVYTQLQADRDAAVALSVLLLVVCVAVLALLRDRWLHGLQGPR